MVDADAMVGASGTVRATRRHAGERGSSDDVARGTAHDTTAPVTTASAAQPGAARDVRSDAASRAVPDEVLLRAAQRDPLAFAPLYQRYATPVFRYCYRQTSDPEVAADLAAQVFTKALEALPRFRLHDRDHTSTSTTSVRSWLFAIAHNAIVDFHRRDRNHPTQSLNAPRRSDHPQRADRGALGDALHELADPALGPEEIAVHHDDLRHLLAVLDQLPGNQRAIIELRLAGLTTNEIAQALGLTQPAVKAAQTRAYSRLRDLLQPARPPADHRDASSDSPHSSPNHHPVEEASR